MLPAFQTDVLIVGAGPTGPMAANQLLRFNIDFIIIDTLPQTGYSYRNKSLAIHTTTQRLKFKAGDRLPFFIDRDGKSNHLEFTAPAFHLLHIVDAKADDHHINKVIQQLHFPVRYVFNTMKGYWKKMGVKAPLFILVRPDNYILSVRDDWPESLEI